MDDYSEQRKSSQDKQKLLAQMEHNDYVSILGTKEGRRFFWRLFQAGFLYQSVFTGNSKTYYLLGIKEFCEGIRQKIEDIAPEKYQLMKTEAKKGEYDV